MPPASRFDGRGRTNDRRTGSGRLRYAAGSDALAQEEIRARPIGEAASQEAPTVPALRGGAGRARTLRHGPRRALTQGSFDARGIREAARLEKRRTRARNRIAGCAGSLRRGPGRALTEGSFDTRAVGGREAARLGLRRRAVRLRAGHAVAHILAAIGKAVVGNQHLARTIREAASAGCAGTDAIARARIRREEHVR